MEPNLVGRHRGSTSIGYSVYSRRPNNGLKSLDIGILICIDSKVQRKKLMSLDVPPSSLPFTTPKTISVGGNFVRITVGTSVRHLKTFGKMSRIDFSQFWSIMPCTLHKLRCPENYAQSPVVPVPSKVLTNATLVKVTNNAIKLHPSVRDSVKITSRTQSLKPSMPKVVPARLVTEPIVSEQHSVLESCLLYHQTNQICLLKGQKVVVLLPPSELIHRP
ncbi:hypothetical protein ACTXT7_001698 [Hymenolepis weldensis]